MPRQKAIGYAKVFSRSHDAVINMIETQEQVGNFKEP